MASSSAQRPTCASPLLPDIVAAVRRRRKAIAYKAGLSCEREFTETSDGAFERLNLDLRHGQVRLSVWADGGLWMSVSVPGKGRNSGWAFQDAFHGDVQDVSGGTLVGMLEAGVAQRLGADEAEEREQVRQRWKRGRRRTGRRPEGRMPPAEFGRLDANVGARGRRNARPFALTFATSRSNSAGTSARRSA